MQYKWRSNLIYICTVASCPPSPFEPPSQPGRPTFSSSRHATGANSGANSILSRCEVLLWSVFGHTVVVVGQSAHYYAEDEVLNPKWSLIHFSPTMHARLPITPCINMYLSSNSYHMHWAHHHALVMQCEIHAHLKGEPPCNIRSNMSRC